MSRKSSLTYAFVENFLSEFAGNRTDLFENHASIYRWCKKHNVDLLDYYVPITTKGSRHSLSALKIILRSFKGTRKDFRTHHADIYKWAMNNEHKSILKFNKTGVE